MGASFTVSVAVQCEELPHELGDFAVLISAVMPWRRALSFNFMSQCLAYLGLVVAILAGSPAGVGNYILALASGLFLYIALVSLMTSLNAAARAAEKLGMKVVLVVHRHVVGRSQSLPILDVQ